MPEIRDLGQMMSNNSLIYMINHLFRVWMKFS